jgi:hypothetical protein
VYARIKYFTRETWVSLRRNTMMTVAGVITVAVSLCVLGGSLRCTRSCRLRLSARARIALPMPARSRSARGVSTATR